MAKRTAAKELTDRNWDVEDEPEEAGQFVQASDDILKSRQIKKAKRRGASGGEEGFNAFSGFSGFKSISSTPTTTTNTVFGGFQNSNTNSATSDSVSKNGSSNAKSESEFLANLKSLNESVIQWMQKHVGKNPYCILTPIFKDYETHLQELEKTKAAAAASKSGFSASTSPAAETKTESAEPSGSFKLSTNGTGGALSSGFTFGAKASLPCTTSSFGGTATTTEGFSFKSTLNPVSAFSLEATSSLSSTSAKSSTGADATTGGEDDEYVPPSVEVMEVQEDGAFYSKRCKLFSQKDGKWLERGVGNVHLKKSDAGKLQLIVRADTNLGNIILNIIMSEGIPVKKQGKNNVFFVSVPNPPFTSEPDDDPVPMLIRVKTSEDAEELVSKIEENRK